MTPYLTPDGWLRVPYDGPEIATIEIRVTGTAWRPAYLDWDGGRRVAQIRWRRPLPPAGRIRVGGTVTGSWGRPEPEEVPAAVHPARAAPHPARRVAGSSRDSSVT